MSIDLEQQLERGLHDLADAAPVPTEWPALAEAHGDHDDPMLIDLSARHPRRVHTVTDRHRRRRVPMVVAVLALAAIIVAAVALSIRNDGPSTVQSAAAPAATAAPTTSSPGIDWGHWDPSGPSLSNDELAQVITLNTNADGTATWHPVRGGFSGSGAVTGVDVVKTTLGSVLMSSQEFSSQDLGTHAVLKYQKSPDAAGAGRSGHGDDTPVWLVKISGNFHLPDPKCADQTTDRCPDSPGVVLTTVGADGKRIDAPFLASAASQVDVDLASFGSVGHWTPS